MYICICVVVTFSPILFLFSRINHLEPHLFIKYQINICFEYAKKKKSNDFFLSLSREIMFIYQIYQQDTRVHARVQYEQHSSSSSSSSSSTRD